MAKFRTKHWKVRQCSTRRRVPAAHIEVVAPKAVVDRWGGLVRRGEIICPSEHDEQNEHWLCDILQLELVDGATSDCSSACHNFSRVLLNVAEQVAKTITATIEGLDCSALCGCDVHVLYS